MSADQIIALVAGAASVLTAIGAIVVTVYNYLGSRDYGRTVDKLTAPSNAALTTVSDALANTNATLQQFISQQGTSLRVLTARQSQMVKLLNDIDQRI